ncbi:MAG: CpsD/CapB family tyrosine-protein kinase [Acholeplasmataceae bacterium]|nr:CpsD/CapB family tyrosine-protein kinase [Acholeplasmataceae bacterium]
MNKKKMKIFAPERNERYDYVVTKEQPLSYTTESFQKVLINLDYANIDKKIKVIEFTSTLASEGKSTFVSNLAYLMGQKNKKTILIDLDLRKPKGHRVFNSANKDGLTDYLSGKISYESLIKHSDEFGIDYIVTGEKTSSIVNVLEAQKLADLIQKLKETYDYILLDAPPVIAVSDALYIAKLADGVIFVVAQNVAKKTLVKEAIQTLRSNNVHIIGTVLTQVSLKGGAYGYGYDYGYRYEED